MNEKDVTDSLPYTTLMFTNGHGYNYTWDGEKVNPRAAAVVKLIERQIFQ